MSTEWDDLAHGLIGSPPRLLIAAHIATLGDDDWFRQEDVRVATQLRQGEVQRIIAGLEKLSLVTSRRQPPHDWPYYKRVPSKVWDAMAKLKDAIASYENGDRSGELDAVPQ